MPGQSHTQVCLAHSCWPYHNDQKFSFISWIHNTGVSGNGAVYAGCNRPGWQLLQNIIIKQHKISRFVVNREAKHKKILFFLLIYRFHRPLFARLRDTEAGFSNLARHGDALYT